MNNLAFFNEGLHLIKDISNNAPVATGPVAICRHLQQGPQLVAYLIAQRRPDTPAVQQELVQLADQVAHTFNRDDLDDLCFRLYVNHEEITGDTSSARARELVTYMHRRNKIPKLTTMCSQLRPDHAWKEWPDVEAELVRKPALSIIVNLASRYAHKMPTDVASYLDQQLSLDVNFVLFEKPGDEKDIDWDNQWNQFATIFARAIREAQRLSGANQGHFFLGGPGPILFAMGCMWGSVEPATVYHRIDGAYQPVIDISRTLHR